MLRKELPRPEVVVEHREGKGRPLSKHGTEQPKSLGSISDSSDASVLKQAVDRAVWEPALKIGER